ncbi:MAG: S-layer homology domain-containing protein [[Eubacterium] siraeum]
MFQAVNHHLRTYQARDWFNNYIAHLEKYKVISGYDDKTFKLDEHITRAEFVTMCMRFYALDAKTVAAKKNIFNDVPKSHWRQVIFTALLVWAG